MVSKKICAASILFFGSAAMADSHGMKHDVQADFRWESGEVTTKAGDADPESAPLTANSYYRLNVKFNPADKVTARIRLNGSSAVTGYDDNDNPTAQDDSAEQALLQMSDYYYVRYAMSDSLSLTFGNDKMKVGGYSYANSHLLHVSDSVANMGQNLGYNNGLGVSYGMGANSFNLQIMRDNRHVNNVGKVDPGTAVAFEWTGDFGAVKPLVQYAVYDFSKSNIMTIGLGWTGNNMGLTFDYITNNMSSSASDDAAKITFNGMDLDFHLEMGAYSPYFRYSTSASKDQDGNEGNAYNNMSIGSYFNYAGTKAFRPYFRYSSTTETDKSGAEEVKNTYTEMALGLTSSL